MSIRKLSEPHMSSWEPQEHGKGQGFALFWRILVESTWLFQGTVIALSECLSSGRIQASHSLISRKGNGA